MLAWTALRDVPAFRRMMKFIILTYSFALLTYWLFPNCQHLRPVLSGNDVLTRLVSMLYRSDTNTNVCPSIHVIGSFAVYFAARDSRMLSKPPIRLTVFILTVLISISTVFLKQHSVLDVLAGLLVCARGVPHDLSPARPSCAARTGGHAKAHGPVASAPPPLAGELFHALPFGPASYIMNGN